MRSIWPTGLCSWKRMASLSLSPSISPGLRAGFMRSPPHRSINNRVCFRSLPAWLAAHHCATAGQKKGLPELPSNLKGPSKHCQTHKEQKNTGNTVARFIGHIWTRRKRTVTCKVVFKVKCEKEKKQRERCIKAEYFTLTDNNLWRFSLWINSFVREPVITFFTGPTIYVRRKPSFFSSNSQVFPAGPLVKKCLRGGLSKNTSLKQALLYQCL